ncbi:MAG TPA: hypothetical protein VMG12_38705 [Polyangiaceae bacterium]|nr:hypothetical protein [Polyangiaceae bacterium]
MLQLDVLLLIRERGGDWSPSEVAGELRVAPQAVDANARDLLGRGLLRYDPTADRYTFAPRSEELRSLIDELVQRHASMRHVIINLIFPGDRPSVLGDGLETGNEFEGN